MPSPVDDTFVYYFDLRTMGALKKSIFHKNLFMVRIIL